MSAAQDYQQAMSIEAYLAQLEQNRDRVTRNIERTKIDPALRARFAGEPLHVLVLTEDWCIDSAQFVPMLIRLSRELPSVEVRFLRRNEHRDLAAAYPRKDGYQAIPIFVLFDVHMRELGALVERPARATEEMNAEIRRFQQTRPDLPGITRALNNMPETTRAIVKEHLARWREGLHDRWTRYFLEDLAEIVDRARSHQSV